MLSLMMSSFIAAAPYASSISASDIASMSGKTACSIMCHLPWPQAVNESIWNIVKTKVTNLQQVANMLPIKRPEMFQLQNLLPAIASVNICELGTALHGQKEHSRGGEIQGVCCPLLQCLLIGFCNPAVMICHRYSTLYLWRGCRAAVQEAPNSFTNHQAGHDVSTRCQLSPGPSCCPCIGGGASGPPEARTSSWWTPSMEPDK